MNKRTICALVIATTIVAVGAAISASRAIEVSQSNKTKTEYQTIRGKPISVDTEIYHHTRGSISTVVEIEGKKILCSYMIEGFNGLDSLTLSNANALIQSEINDGDDEQIELTGQYKGNEFKINSLKANGYKVSFE